MILLDIEDADDDSFVVNFSAIIAMYPAIYNGAAVTKLRLIDGLHVFVKPSIAQILARANVESHKV